MNRLVDSSNFRLKNIRVHEPASSGPYIPDSKIQLLLSKVIFFKDDNVYNYASQNIDDNTRADYILNNYIKTRSDLSKLDKENTLHIIMSPGGDACCAGLASWFGDKDWILLEGYDYQFNWGENSVNKVVSHFIHEIGHSLGLYHSWTSSSCESFTKYVSNNYMDYDILYGKKYSLTDCQLSRVHYCLMGNYGNISDCFVEDYCSYNCLDNIFIDSGEDILWNSAKNLRGSITINQGGILNINCKISIPKEGSITVNAGGKLIIEEGEFRNSCDEDWNGIAVRNGGYLELRNTNIVDFNIDIEAGGTIRISEDLLLSNDHQIDIDPDAYVCIDNNTHLNLVDFNNIIILNAGYNVGVNTTYVSNPGTCLTNFSSIPITGLGSIKNRNTNTTYIQNVTYNSNQYLVGNDFYAGTDVNPDGRFLQGPVIINSGANVILDTSGETYLENGFEIKLGGEFEVRNKSHTSLPPELPPKDPFPPLELD